MANSMSRAPPIDAADPDVKRRAVNPESSLCTYVYAARYIMYPQPVVLFPVGAPGPPRHIVRVRIVHRSLSPRDNDSEKLLFPTFQRVTSARARWMSRVHSSNDVGGDDSRLLVRIDALDVKSDPRVGHCTLPNESFLHPISLPRAR